ncbi:MAG: alkaline phosphatase family protein [Cytophagales bacterium]|nr:MAG: alkaline phosphatase family protein [Cytophagales bacterium]TAF60119.1 MAG: alkaline phosphatase family protein [Cytophagales bacterium]
MKLFNLFLFHFLFLSSWVLAQEQPLLKSGPMVGYSGMREVALWAQTSRPASVHIEYWVKGLETTKFKTNVVQTSKSNAFVAQLLADEVLPDKVYEYTLFLDNKAIKMSYPLEFQAQQLWKWRTNVPPPTFSFALGSCLYVNETPYDRGGKPYGGDYEIFTAIQQKKPDFMLWLGDNTYLREADWDTRTGILHRHTHTRSLPELQPLLGRTHHYAIWDDHDYGPNDSDKSYAQKHLTLEAFKLFWANPNYGVANNGQGISGSFDWADVQFFMLDNRSFRTSYKAKNTYKEVYGKEQIDWLINSLTASTATFKIIVSGTQVLNDAPIYENYAVYEERADFLKRLRESGVRGIMFLSGDRHHTVLSKMKESPELYPFYDFTVSPLTSGTYPMGEDEKNTWFVPNSMFAKKNFAIVTVSGERKERVLTLAVYDQKGAELWSQKISEKELR